MPNKSKAGRSNKREQSESSKKLVEEIVAALRHEVRERLGPNSTFEQRRDAGFEIMRDVLWKDGDDDLQESITDADEVDVDGKRYGRLKQSSSARYTGRFGPHYVEEPLYRELGVHNGPTIKPIELRMGIIEHMTPDMARVVGALSAERGSRALERTLRIVGHVPPSRAFLADRITAMGAKIADVAADLESDARAAEIVSEEVASVSCGLDRMSVRMNEVIEGNSVPPRTRTEPYQRTPPLPSEHHYRMAWVGSTSTYDVQGKELHTWRVAMEADADRDKLADRVAADVAWIVHTHPGVPVHCIQDAGPELRALPEALTRVLPAETVPVVLVDFEHLMGYLDEVVDTCEPDGDPRDMKGWYRSKLLQDDGAIDRIQRTLRDKAKRLPGRNTAARKSVAAALRYIKLRKDKMRYASLYEANLPIGSGATESTCWQMQQRVKLPGQSWEPHGLRGVLAIRGLVLSERWDTAWPSFAAEHRANVRAVA